MSDDTNFEPNSGVKVRSKVTGKLILWLKQKDVPPKDHYALLRTWPENCATEAERVKLQEAVKAVLFIAALDHREVFDFAEIEPQLSRYSTELGDVAIKRLVSIQKTEDIEVSVTDLVSGKKITLVIGVTARPIKHETT